MGYGPTGGIEEGPDDARGHLGEPRQVERHVPRHALHIGSAGERPQKDTNSLGGRFDVHGGVKGRPPDQTAALVVAVLVAVPVAVVANEVVVVPPRAERGATGYEPARLPGQPPNAIDDDVPFDGVADFVDGEQLEQLRAAVLPARHHNTTCTLS